MNIGNALNMQMNAAAQNEGLKRSPLETRPADRPQEAAKAASSEKRFADVINEKTSSKKTAKAEPSDESQNKKKTKAATQEDVVAGHRAGGPVVAVPATDQVEAAVQHRRRRGKAQAR